MHTVEISDSLFDEIDDEISKEAAGMGNLQGSIENGGGNYAGLFGEILFCEYVGGERNPTYDYDVEYDGLTVDVKTKRRSVTPEPYYEASIADYNTEQDCDIYYFVSVRYDYSKATLCGYMSPDEYYERAEFHEEGDLDPDNGFEFQTDCWNLPYTELESDL